MMTETDMRAAAARRAFWTDHPLCAAYQRATGSHSFSLKQLIEFVRRMPPAEFNAAQYGAARIQRAS